ncbi:MAG: hypothetical protein KDB26_04170 [Microthrixaceae bacterium]|nr:hypothetical protein [Microthrixaceae bacterium]
MKMRLLPTDDFMHVPEDASNFNESRYYNFFDQGSSFGGWVRMGNRVNEGYAELTVCLYLPDGSVGFIYDRPKIETNNAHDAGGLRFDVIEPFVRHQITFDRKVCLLANPREMSNPREAFTNNPFVTCQVELALDAVGPIEGGEPEWEEGDKRLDQDPERMFARGHTEQHMGITGTVSVGDQRFEIADGLGMRDHSWGPRYWQNVWWYRWLTVNLGPDLGIGCTIGGDESGKIGSRGFVYDRKRYGDDRFVAVRRASITSDYDEDWIPRTNTLTVTTEDHVYEIAGEVWSNIPLRNRRDGKVTRITEGATRWSYDGIVGTGMSEYLDQIVDDVPVGTEVGY